MTFDKFAEFVHTEACERMEYWLNSVGLKEWENDEALFAAPLFMLRDKSCARGKLTNNFLLVNVN